MRHKKYNKKLNRTSSHRKLMLSNMIISLIKYEHITTTVVKAKALKPVIDKIITLGKKNTLHARRLILSKINNNDIVNKIFNILNKRYHDRKGGYSRIIRIGFRYGDNAPLAIIQLIK